ncbi:cache domain-containing protein [Paenibacillus sp. P25]|nr:cache domain-containing protein [Paenibacillus sp. P25]
MRRWKNLSHQTKLLVVFFLLSSIPAMLIGAMAYRKSSDMLYNQTKRDLDVILAQLNASIERQVNDFDRFTMLPYFMPDIFQFLNRPYVPKEKWGTAELNAQKTMVRLMSAYPSINSSINGLMVYGMNGTVNGYRMRGDSIINLDDNVKEDSWYKKVLAEKGGFVVTGVHEIKQFAGTPFPAVIGSRSLMDDDYKPLAVIAIFISPDFIPKIVRSLNLSNVQVTVVDGEGKLIYASDNRLAERLRGTAPGQKKGVWELTDEAETGLDQVQGKGAASSGTTTYSGVFLQSDYLGWKTYMGVNRDEMLQGSRSIRNFTVVIVIVLGFAVAGRFLVAGERAVEADLPADSFDARGGKR